MDSDCSNFKKMLPWLVWGMSSLFVTFQMLLQTSPSVMIGDLQQAFSLDTFGVSLLASSFFYTYVFFQIPAGMVIDRIQPRYCVTLCLLGVAVTTLVFANSHSLEMARASRIFQGAFSAFSVVPALYLAAIWFPSRQFALLAGLTEMIGMSGSAIGQAMLAPISGHFGWRGALIGCAMVGFLMTIVTWFIVRNPAALDESEHPPAPHKTHVFRDLLTVISYPQAWINGFFGGLMFAISGAFFSFWCIPFLINVYGVSLNMAAATSSMGLFGVAFGAPVIGWLSDRFGLRRLPMILSTVVVMLLMLVVLYVPNINIVLMFILFFMLGFSSAGYVLSYAVMRDIVPSHVRGTAMGYTNMMCILVGAPVLQPLIGWLLKDDLVHYADKARAYQHALSVLPVCVGVGLVLTLLVRETYCGRKTC
jgi:MFS family permease